MRLKEFEIEAIKSTIKEFDRNAEVFLFGSRTDDTKKGGDIDVLVISGKIGLTEKIKIKIKLYNTLGERKIDIITTPEINSAFLKYIYQQAIQI
ncbi:MAG: nucleotidyltransferase domain-containing protein [Bacteroidetes bacterium]|nr:nucleotidyltransferase domain-containing protein [Bacteroidota bacterium]MBU1677337.1 nucleotidyltransferase domain-containing protein [Bacteroidota bacterium]